VVGLVLLVILAVCRRYCLCSADQPGKLSLSRQRRLVFGRQRFALPRQFVHGAGGRRHSARNLGRYPKGRAEGAFEGNNEAKPCAGIPLARICAGRSANERPYRDRPPDFAKATLMTVNRLQQG